MLLETRTRPGNVRHLIYGLNPLITLLKQHQADVDALLGTSRIPATALGDPDYMLTPAQELRFTELALAQLGQPDLGIRLGPRYHLSAYGMLGLAVMTSSNLIEAFRVLFHNILMTWTYMHWKLRTEQGVAIIALDKQRDLGGCHQYMIDRGLVAAYTIAAEALGKALPLHAVNVTQPQPDYAGAYDEFFNCPVNFSAPANDFRFDESYLYEPLLQSETASARVFAAQCERICAELERGGSFAELIRQHLVQLPHQLASLETIAERLCTTPRTIQRKLASEDTSFKELVEDVRKNLSFEYLQSTALSVEEIALRLGYSDAPSFSHAFKRWTGVSPRDARRGE
ncbi:MAG: AraC family transcriptional regulator [Gammaproteobacteria bacterium]|nr:AraC family transcriptional regulator [Gammaproteobacteria bacterium]